MSNKINRRDVLKTVGTVSAMNGFAVTASASQDEQIRVVEAGIRYEAPANENYDRVLPDSRPPYTIKEENQELLLLNTASPSAMSHIKGSANLLKERSVDRSTEVTIGPQDGMVTALPTDLSARMRVTDAIRLISPLQVPMVTLQANEKVAVLNVASEGTVELPVGKRIEVKLDSVMAEARTSHVVGQASIEGVPERLQGLKRERDSIEIEVTPIVEAVNHGELVVEQQSTPPR